MYSGRVLREGHDVLVEAVWLCGCVYLMYLLYCVLLFRKKFFWIKMIWDSGLVVQFIGCAFSQRVFLFHWRVIRCVLKR